MKWEFCTNFQSVSTATSTPSSPWRPSSWWRPAWRRPDFWTRSTWCASLWPTTHPTPASRASSTSRSSPSLLNQGFAHVGTCTTMQDRLTIWESGNISLYLSISLSLTQTTYCHTAVDVFCLFSAANLIVSVVRQVFLMTWQKSIKSKNWCYEADVFNN